MRQPLGEDGLRLAAEVLDGPVELSGQSLRRILARPLDLVGELLLEGVGEAARGSLDDPLQLVDLAPFDLGQPRLDPLGRIRLLGADALPQLALAQPLCDLVQRAAPVAFVLLQLGVRPFRDLADDPLELRGKCGQPVALLLADRLEVLRLDGDPGRGLADQLLLALAEALELPRESPLRAFEISAPFAEPAADALLDPRQRLAQLCARALLAFVDGR